MTGICGARTEPVCSKEEWEEAANRRLTQVMALKQLVYLIEEALKKGNVELAQKLVDTAKDI
jgi:hypothetical protein